MEHQKLQQLTRITINNKTFIQNALLSDHRVDGRRPFDYRNLTIKFGGDDGSSAVQLGQTHVISFVTAQLLQPYKDRPNEGSLSVFTEFSPMADPSFEPGRASESAVELGRIVDRGLRESRAIDTESLCVVAGKMVWAIRIDIHVVDNGGNLVDAANVAALAALLSFRRPECSLAGEDAQQVVVHPPEEREPLPLIIHHLPIAVTFGFFSNENLVVIDPTYHEESVMTGRMTTTLNANGDVCSIQKAGGEGVSQRVIMHCLKLAHVKAGGITTKIRDAVEIHNTERALRKIKRHSSSAPVDVCATTARLEGKQNDSDGDKDGGHLDQLKLKDEANAVECDATSSGSGQNNKKDELSKNFIGGPSRASTPLSKQKDSQSETKREEQAHEVKTDSSSAMNIAPTAEQSNEGKTLKDAVKPKNKRKKKASSNSRN